MSQVQFSLLGLKYIASSPPSMYCTFLPLLLPSSPLPLVFFSPPPFLFLPNFLSFSFSSYSSPLLFIPLPSLLSLFFLLLLPSFSLPPQLLFPSPSPSPLLYSCLGGIKHSPISTGSFLPAVHPTEGVRKKQVSKMAYTSSPLLLHPTARRLRGQ